MPLARAAIGLIATCMAALGAPDSTGFDFFEQQIRPVLAERCYGCHSAKSPRVQGGLYLDTRDGMRKGGNSGPAITPGDPERSLLIKAIRYTDDKLKMPPGKPLSGAEAANFEAWVKMGAPDPRSTDAAQPPDPFTQARKFWSFQRPKKARLPDVTNAAWGSAPVDRFILAKLEEKGLSPAPPAGKRILIRRVTYDLTGLPPTPAEIDAFLADGSPDAFAKVVDRLLASPHYGERWGRHWLDVARYSDTTDRGKRYPYSYTYRDWVVSAFNSDMPYNQFLIEQIAADRLHSADHGSLAALGFITLGRDPPKALPDTIDDRIDVITRGALGLTVTCARCHDHKYDPIPTRDYYSLYGVIANTREPLEPPLLAPVSTESDTDRFYEGLIRHWEDKIVEYRRKRHAILTAALKTPEELARYRSAVEETAAMSNTDVENFARTHDLNLYLLLRWRKTGNEDAMNAPLEDFEKLQTEGDSNNLRDLRDHLRDVMTDWAYRGGPKRAMALEDTPEATAAHVFVRGNANNPGAIAPRQFLAILSESGPRTFSDGSSGRLDLARAIGSDDNPLTARVIVNRLWQYHFGEGLVRSPSDFGARGDRPTHPELLDYLAVRFMEEGWSIKKLHRTILLSNAYQQSSADNPKARDVDPENMLLWRMNRQRMDFEALRDSMLAVAGRLDPAVGGLPYILIAQPADTRRTLYAFIDRAQLPGVLSSFDFASPEQHSPKRFTTTVPQQALFMMNNPFVAEQAKYLAARVEIAGESDFGKRIERLYGLLFGRSPTADEIRMGRAFIAAAPSAGDAGESATASAWQYGLGEFDKTTQRVRGFEPFRYFAGDRWLFDAVSPSITSGAAFLSALGGYPGDDSAHSAIRRWIAPSGGTVSIDGEIKNTQRLGEEFGDGVLARIVSSRSGELASGAARDSKAELKVAAVEVKAGDTIDFVVECRADSEGDNFTWAPVITMSPRTWNSAKDFHGPSPLTLDVWARYAQVLLNTNEFAFVE
jgi:hypothetical protein